MEEFQIEPMFTYSVIPIVILSTIIVINIILLKKNKRTDFKKKYLLKIAILENKVHLNKMNKDYFQKLSLIIRNYIYETTNIKIQNYSLKEIKKLKNKSLTNLMEQLYKYEFSNIKCKNTNDLFNQAKDVIKNDNKI